VCQFVSNRRSKQHEWRYSNQGKERAKHGKRACPRNVASQWMKQAEMRYALISARGDGDRDTRAQVVANNGAASNSEDVQKAGDTRGLRRNRQL
jgi:hypothetical protein